MHKCFQLAYDVFLITLSPTPCTQCREITFTDAKSYKFSLTIMNKHINVSVKCLLTAINNFLHNNGLMQQGTFGNRLARRCDGSIGERVNRGLCGSTAVV